MKSALVAAGALLALAGRASAKSPAAQAPAPPVRARPVATAPAFAPAPPLAVLPRIARVRIEAARNRVVLIEELSLARADWQSGGLDLFVAFGAPGAPAAMDAHMVPVPAGMTEPRTEDVGEVAALEPSARRGARANLFLGKPQMAGAVIHIKAAALEHAFAGNDFAALRIRSLLSAPALDANGARGVVVRLGAPDGLPMTLGRIQVVSLEQEPWITRAESALCGPEADTKALSTALFPRPPPPRAGAGSKSAPPQPLIAPELSVRHASDDLCVRWWAP